MASFDELRAQLEGIRSAAADTDTRLDAINTKIDELRALVNAGGVVSQAQLDELSAIAAEAQTSLAVVQGDLTDAEQS